MSKPPEKDICLEDLASRYPEVKADVESVDIKVDPKPTRKIKGLGGLAQDTATGIIVSVVVLWGIYYLPFLFPA